MSVQKVNVLVPPLRPVPPAAAWAANAVAWLFVNDPRHPGLATWLAEARERRRAARAVRRNLAERMALLALARRYEHEPAGVRQGPRRRRPRRPAGLTGRGRPSPAEGPAGARRSRGAPRYTSPRSADLSGLRALYKYR